MTRCAFKHSDSGSESKRNIPPLYVEEFKEFQIRVKQKGKRSRKGC